MDKFGGIIHPWDFESCVILCNNFLDDFAKDVKKLTTILEEVGDRI